MELLYLLALPIIIAAWPGLGFLSRHSTHRGDGSDWCGPPPTEPGPSLLSRLRRRLRP